MSDPEDVSCPTCGVGPRVFCSWAGTPGIYVGSHWPRHAAALQVETEELEQ